MLQPCHGATGKRPPRRRPRRPVEASRAACRLGPAVRKLREGRKLALKVRVSWTTCLQGWEACRQPPRHQEAAANLAQKTLPVRLSPRGPRLCILDRMSPRHPFVIRLIGYTCRHRPSNILIPVSLLLFRFGLHCTAYFCDQWPAWPSVFALYGLSV